MYARGMTTREIQGRIEEIYGFEAPTQRTVDQCLSQTARELVTII